MTIRPAIFFTVISVMLTLLYGSTGYCIENKNICIKQFKVFSGEKDLKYLEKQIPEILAQQLKKDGGIVTEFSLPADGIVGELNAGTISNLKSDCRYIITGSLTMIGDNLSLDIVVLDLADAGKRVLFSEEGKGIEKLLSVVNNLGMKLGVFLFKLETINEIIVRGNTRIESDAILRVIKTRPDDRFHAAKLTEDLKRIFAMGYFEDIRIEAERSKGTSKKQTTVIFYVKEKPTIRKIRIKGNRAFESEKIIEDITISKGSILNSGKIKENINRIKEMYNEKNYHNTTIKYKTYNLDNNQADLEFIIDEGEKVKIKTITFEGNKFRTDKKLRKMMKTKEKGFFSWLTSSGTLDIADLNVDVAIIGNFYQQNGFIDARISEPEIVYEGQWIFVSIKIDEGIRYKVGKIDLQGDLLKNKEDYLEVIKISDEEYCNREIIQKDIIALTDIYSDEGYASADINPIINRDRENQTAEISYDIRKGNKVFFDKIVITGNVVTRDKVIRRQLRVYEQELYSGTRLKRGIRNLHRLDYFEDIKVTTDQNSPDKMNLLIDVKEKPTGTFTFGMGYSSEDKFFGTLSVSKRNLFGRDQTLNIKAEKSSDALKYTTSFTEPWLFDIPLSGMIEFYNWEKQYDYYDKDTLGGGVKFGYPLWDYTRGYVAYSHDISEIVYDDSNERYVSYDIQDLRGKNNSNSLAFTVRYDSRDKAVNATEGSDHYITAETVGGFMGGDFNFSKYTISTSWFIPMIWDNVFAIHGEGGYLCENSGGGLPDDEKFYLGGINSIRGFQWHDIHLIETKLYNIDEDPEDEEVEVEVGGDKYAQFNLELIHPLFKTQGLVALIFYDRGNVYEKNDAVKWEEMRSSYGYGVRWYSPIGPLHFIWGYIVDPLEGEPKHEVFEFSMNGVF